MGEKADLLRKLHGLEQQLAPGAQRDAITASIAILTGVPRRTAQPAAGTLIPEEPKPKRRYVRHRPLKPKEQLPPTYTGVKPPGTVATRGPDIREALWPVGTFDYRWHQAIDGLMVIADDFSETPARRERARQVLHNLGVGMPRKDASDVSYPVYNRVQSSRSAQWQLHSDIRYEGWGHFNN